MRCQWCGRFVPKDTEPMAGLNRHGERIEQVLCREHAPDWHWLATMNLIKWPDVARKVGTR